MPTQRSTAFRKAYDYIRARIDRARGAAPVRLPTERLMAADAGVAIATMHKAVRQHVASGALTAAQRRGIFVVRGKRPPDPLADRTPAPGRKFQRLARCLEREILTGAIGDPARETLKALAARYGANVKTMRKALDLLPHSRDIPPPGPRSSRERGSTLIVYGSGSRDSLGYLGTSTREIIRRFEEECFRRNLALRTRSYEFRTGRLRHPRGETPDDRAALGYVILPVAFPRAVFDDLVARLTRREKPVAVVDETGEFASCARASVKYVSIACSPDHGRKMGEHLFSRGHRRIAFVSLFRDDLWSQRRLAGIREVFDTHGGTVLEAVLPSMSVEEQYGHFDRAAAPVREILELSFDRLPAGERRYLVSRTRADLQDMLHNILVLNRHRARLIPVFASLRDSPGITAWACANDLIAIEALHYLRREKISGAVSVTGFDNSPDSFLHDLTTYSFGEQSAVDCAMEHVLHGARRYRSVAELDAMPGHVVERGSVRAPGRP